MSPQFFYEDNDALARFYYKEQLLSYPFPWSEERIAYVEEPGLTPELLPNLVVKVRGEYWEIPSDVEQRVEPAFREWLLANQSTWLYRGNNVRCSGWVAGLPSTMDVQRVRYQDYVRTNLVLDYRPENQKTLREFIHPAGSLDTLQNSRLGNNLGINILFVNEIGDVPLQVRSENVAVRAGQLCSSASGTLELNDIPAEGTALAQCDLLREAREEMGDQFVTTHLKTLVILGFARELARGGQPELFLVAEGSFTRNDAKRGNANAKHGFGKEASAIEFLPLGRSGNGYCTAQIQQALRVLEDRIGAGVSASLKANLSLWFRHLHVKGLLQ